MPVPPDHADVLRLADLESAALRRQLLDCEHALPPVLDPALGTEEVERLSDLQRLNVLSHLPSLGELRVHVLEVNLDDKVDDALVHVAARGSVRARLLLPLLVRVRQRDVLADREAEDVVLGLQREAEQAGVMADLDLLLKRELNLLLGIERLLRAHHLGDEVEDEDGRDDDGCHRRHQHLRRQHGRVESSRVGRRRRGSSHNEGGGICFFFFLTTVCSIFKHHTMPQVYPCFRFIQLRLETSGESRLRMDGFRRSCS